MPSRSYVIGIDLGTSNCAVAFADASQGASAAVADFPILQLRRPGEVALQALLPSFLYVPSEHELPAGSTRLPWGESPRFVVGEFSRWQGSRVPGRVVASAKSWLCHVGVDRCASILPWGAPAEIPKLSPVEASAMLLAHMASAWNSAHPETPLSSQDVVVTVPASFDEVARALTVTAARQAGLEKFTLVEEPQAAFYDFTARHRDQLARVLNDVRLVLVVDVGGGTTDFTLIQVGIAPEGPVLRRIAVGEHLILGGDNMDAALARRLENRLLGSGRKLGATQWAQLVQVARAAKESLLGADAPEHYAVSVAAEGSRLLQGTLSTELTREEAEQVILDGFLPACHAEETPKRGARMALQEMGLPYAQDPALTRHLAGFLRQHARSGWEALGSGSNGESRGPLPRPDAILLNGGVFNAPKIARRLVEVASSWWPDAPPVPLLPQASLSLAVARGAAQYGLVRRGMGLRIGGGSAHALWVGLAGSRDQTSPRAVCLIPRGQEEGQPVDLASQPFKLTLGRAVQFPLFSTSAGRIDRPGDVVEVTEQFHALPPIHTLLKGSGNQPTAVPVHLRAVLTELGTLELWCVSDARDERWRLEFELRGVVAASTTTVTESMPARFDSAREMVERVFGPKSTSGEVRDAKQLARNLEKINGPRETWRLPVLRELWSVLFSGAKRRRRSSVHERTFLQLAGYCLRPGFGYPLDEWRCEQTFKLFEEGVVHHGEQPVWNEFWVLWRRISGGLDETRQCRMWDYLKPYLAKRIPLHPTRTLVVPKGVRPGGTNEMVRAAASLEHLDPAEKVVLGNWIAERLKDPAATAGPWAWALGRLGGRAPLYGSGHRTVPADQAAGWVSLLLNLGLGSVQNAAFATAQLARLTGDRTRDLDDEIRARVVEALKGVRAPEHWLQAVTEVAELEAAEEAHALGDTLPIGLRLR